MIQAKINKNQYSVLSSTKSKSIQSCINWPNEPGFLYINTRRTVLFLISIRTDRASKVHVTWYSLITFAFSVLKHLASPWLANSRIPSHPIFLQDWFLKFVSIKQSTLHCAVYIVSGENYIYELSKTSYWKDIYTWLEISVNKWFQTCRLSFPHLFHFFFVSWLHFI